jgi:polysaccharide biosynthesis protein PslJ
MAAVPITGGAAPGGASPALSPIGGPGPIRWGTWRGPAAVAAGAAGALALGWLSAQWSPLVAVGVVAGATALALALRHALITLLLLLAVIALLPFGVLPLRIGVAPTFLDAATALVLLLWLAGLARRRAAAWAPLPAVVLLAFAAQLGVAYVFSPEPLRPDETARTFAKLVAAHLVLLPVVWLVRTRAQAALLAHGLVLLAAAEAAIGVALYVAPRGLAFRALSSLAPLGYPTGDSVLRYRPEKEILRANGTAVDPNMLGALLLVAGAVAGAQLVAQRPLLPRPWFAAALAPICLCLLLTDSRGSWLGLAGGLLLVGGLKYRRLWVGFGALAALALVTPQAARFTGHLFSGLRAQDRASSMRLGEIENALAIIARHPWFGVGWGQGGDSIELEFTLGVSNVVLTVAERSGLPAAALYCLCWLAVGVALLPALRARLRASDDDGLLLGLAAAVAGAAIAGMVDHHFVRFPHLVTLLWFVAGLALVVGRFDRQADMGGEALMKRGVSC